MSTYLSQVLVLVLFFGVVLFFIIILTTYTLYWVEAKKESEKDFIACRWCRSIYGVVICKEIGRFLRTNNIDYIYKSITDINSENRKGKKMIKPWERIELPEHRIMIEFWRDLPVVSFFGLPNHISVGFETGVTSEDSEQFLCFLKENLERILEEMPKKNELCIRCNGKLTSTCYGGNRRIQSYGHSLNQLIELIDPYRDEKTLHDLIKRKERLNGKEQSGPLEQEYRQYISEELLQKEKLFEYEGKQ